MQTFLPYPDFVESAGVLDNRRLGRQRAEVVQVLDILHEINRNEAWRDHPVVRMWRGYEVALCEYGLIVCEEWQARDNRDSMSQKIETHMDWATSGNFRMDKPPWFGREDFHLGHQAELIRLDPEYYKRKFPNVPANLPCIWPEMSDD